MKTLLAITDLTRMYRRKVCIAGYDTHLQCKRLVSPEGGVHEMYLYRDGIPIIFPFSVIELDLLTPNPQPPHTEDTGFIPESIKFVRQVKDREDLLRKSLYQSVNDVFEQEIRSDFGFYVRDCQGPRSIGTILPAHISQVLYAPENEKSAWDYRILFYDSTHTWFRLKITDLTWQHYCDHLRVNGMEHSDIAIQLTNQLKSSKVYLRIGLSRGWKEHPDKCFLQVNGIYTFPDYLNGQNFHDYKNLFENGLRETPDEVYGEVEETY